MLRPESSFKLSMPQAVAGFTACIALFCVNCSSTRLGPQGAQNSGSDDPLLGLQVGRSTSPLVETKPGLVDLHLSVPGQSIPTLSKNVQSGGGLWDIVDGILIMAGNKDPE